MSTDVRGDPPPLGYHVPTMQMQLGQRVKQMREYRRYYRSTFAKLIGVSSHMVRRIETQKVMPRTDTLLRMANALGVSVNYLISDAEVAIKFNPIENFNAGFTRWG